MPAPTAAESPPTSAAVSPCRLPMTTIMSNTPGARKLPIPYSKAHVRRKGCLQRKRQASATFDRSVDVSASRGSWNGARMARSDTVENP